MDMFLYVLKMASTIHNDLIINMRHFIQNQVNLILNKTYCISALKTLCKYFTIGELNESAM